jgi:CHAD domain-containing protein
MAYRFLADHTVEDNVHRMMSEQLEKAIHQLEDTFEQEPGEAIHDARKRLKKCRSLLRLVRKSMPKETYKQEKNALRGVGRSLSAARDSEVYQETLDDLLDVYELTLDVESFSDLRESLARLNQTQLQKLRDRDNPLATYIDELKASKQRLNQLALDQTDWAAIAPNLHRLYRQGQERFAAAYAEGTDKAFHEWRKRVKDLWYDTRLLQGIWPTVMDAFAVETHQLSKLLGDGHDIAELRDFLENHPEAVEVSEVHIKVLLPLMGHRQYKLRQQAKDLGQKLYAENPDAFMQRLESYWYTWFESINTRE